MIERLALLLLIGGCLMFGAIIFLELEPAGAEDAAVAKVAARPDTAPTMRLQQNPRIDELLAATLARPLFSSTRRPPQSASTDAATDSDLADTRLTGIVTEPGRRTAIFAVNGDKPLRAAEGEAVSGWRIESITPREVSLSGPSGTKTLQQDGPGPASGQPPAGNAGVDSDAACGSAGPPAAGAGSRPPVPAVAGGQPGRLRPPGQRDWSATMISAWRARIVLVGCQLPSQPGLEPLEQPSELQAAEPRVSGKIPIDRGRQSAFEERGVATAPVVPPPRPASATGQAGDVTLNFVDTDIREIIRTILGTTLKVNYTIDPNVHGTGSIDTGTPLTREALLPTLETLLNQRYNPVGRNGVMRCRSPQALPATSSPVRTQSAVEPRSSHCATPLPKTSQRFSSPMSPRVAR
jgi:hypothetical protein